jgi:hypothetical protein
MIINDRKRNGFLSTGTGNSKIRNVFLFLAAAGKCFCMTNKAMAQRVDYGTTGSCTWTLTGTSGNYTLTISGSGTMGNYDYYSLLPPWYLYQSDIKTVDIQQGVTSIGSSAFYKCIRLTSIAIPHSVTSIGDNAFTACDSLTSVTIPHSVTSIGFYAFAYCYNLTQVTIPHSVTWIGDEAFACCTALTSVTIGNSVTWIGEMAFDNCTGLTSVTNLNSMPQTINSNVFANVTVGNITLYVPTESAEDYKAAAVWKDFGTITAYTPAVE